MTFFPGTSGADTIDGSLEADVIEGRAGDDVINSSLGDDLVTAGTGNDSVTADFGNDTIYGGDGNDTIWAGGGTDSLNGGLGDDYMVMGDINYGGLTTALGGGGNDTFTFFSTVSGSAAGGSGIDMVAFFTTDDEAIFVDLASQTVTSSGGFANVTFSSMERLSVYSYGGDDTVTAGKLNDVISVGGGANTVYAKAGNDAVAYVATTASTLSGGDGYDVLTVGAGESSLYFIVSQPDGTVDDGQLSVIDGFEEYVATGGRFADIAAFAAGNDSFSGAHGQDTVFGNAGNDSLYGGGGQDSINGGDGNDFLAGGTGDDVVDAGAGSDRIQFYLGNDTITGGTGRDLFLFTRNQSGFQTITDFESGVDQLRFTGIFLPGGPPAGPLDPALLSYGAASGSAAQFVLTYDAGSDTSTLLWDDNGDNPAGGAYSFATFYGNIALLATDILIL